MFCGENPPSTQAKVSYTWDESQKSARCEETSEGSAYQMSKDLGGKG